MADENEVLSIECEVKSDKAKKELKQWNEELQKAGSLAEKKQKLLAFSIAKPKLKKSRGKKTLDDSEYASDIFKMRAAALKIAKMQKEVLDTSNYKTASERIRNASAKELGKTFDKTTFYGDADVEQGKVVGVITEIEKGIKRVTKEIRQSDGEWHNLTETITKAKGVFVSDGMKGDVILETKKADTTTYRTQEIANGFKIIREYIKQANGELYLMAEKTTEIKEKAKETPKGYEKLKNVLAKIVNVVGLEKTGSSLKNLGKKIGSIITYRIARSLLSAFTNAFKQGFNLLSEDNTIIGSVKDTFSSISTSIQASLTTILIPLFETLSSVLSPIADDFINMGNAISLSNAQAQGQSEYFELSREKIDAYAKSLRQANKQLSQLDKFATLNGSKKVDLGSMVSVDDAAKNDLLNIEKYQNIIDFIDTISVGIAKMIDIAKDVFKFITENIDLVAAGLGLLFTFANPLLGLFGSLILLFTNTEPKVKLLASAFTLLATTLIGLSIAKAFAINPLYGLAIGASAGIILAGIAGISSAINSGSGNASSATFNTGGYSGSYNSSEFYDGISRSTKNGYTSSGATTIRGDVYIDGQKAGKIIETSVYNEGTRVGHFKG